MSTDANNAYHLPNKMGRIILLGMEEILGRDGLHAVLDASGLPGWSEGYPPDDMRLEFPFSDLSRLQATLEELYGPRGGCGVALRSGRAGFKFGLRQFGDQLGMTEMSFRLLPLSEKLPQGAELLAGLFNQVSDQRVRVETNDTHILWHIERCPVCSGRTSQEPLCHLAVGLLQEALYWVSGGKTFIVEETACIARGDPACTIAISRQPLDQA
jgi:predicted hydrocarbon binding protein